MMEFTLCLAELPIRASVLHDGTRDYCADYLAHQDDASSDEPAFSVAITQSDIDAERQLSDVQQKRKGLPLRNSPDSYLETLALYRAIAERLPAYDVVLMHGSALAFDGVAYLFTGRSGAGKSTHARMWCDRYESQAVMINDDKPLLSIGCDGVSVYGTPWDGKHRLSSNISAPLRAICLINQAEHNDVKRLAKQESWNVVMKQVYRPQDIQSGMLSKTLDLVDEIVSAVPVYSAQCTLDDAIVPLVHDALVAGK